MRYCSVGINPEISLRAKILDDDFVRDPLGKPKRKCNVKAGSGSQS